MKQITLYTCEHCDYKTTDRTDCLEHEANKHYHITLEQYETWKQLNEQAAHAGAIVSQSKNPVTEKHFDDAINELIRFEKEHNLPDKQPYHF